MVADYDTQRAFIRILYWPPSTKRFKQTTINNVNRFVDIVGSILYSNYWLHNHACSILDRHWNDIA